MPGSPGFAGQKVLKTMIKLLKRSNPVWILSGDIVVSHKTFQTIYNQCSERAIQEHGWNLQLQLRELRTVAKFVLDTKDLELCIVPTMSDGILCLEALSDSDFANDKETRIRIYGYIVFFCGVPTVWKSKSMKSVVMSTTEAEYVAVSEVVKEIKFLYQLLRSMEIKLPLPNKIKVDNMEAIWLASNSGVSERTKHVVIRDHFVRSYVMDEVVTIDFVKSAENTSDIMTKNQQCIHF